MAVAERLAERCFAGRVRLNDDLAIDHARRVAKRLDTEHEKIVAFLHDVIEDTGLDPVVLHSMFGPEVYRDVMMLTHDKEGESYSAYIERVITRGSHTACRVKMADLADNLNGAPSTLRRRYMRAMSEFIERREEKAS